MIFSKLNEMKEIVNCFFANADLEGDNVVLVNKNDRDDVKVLDLDFKYFWSYNNGLTIHIRDKENKIDININNVVELDNGDMLDLGEFVLDIM